MFSHQRSIVIAGALFCLGGLSMLAVSNAFAQQSTTPAPTERVVEIVSKREVRHAFTDDLFFYVVFDNGVIKYRKSDMTTGVEIPIPNEKTIRYTPDDPHR